MATKIERWSTAKLVKELHFAAAAIDPNHPETSEWLYRLEVEADRRSRMSELH